MNLVIDQGNTRTKAGIFQGNKLIANHQFEKFEKNDIIELLDFQPGIRYSILSSVIDTNNILKEILIKRTEFFLELGSHTPLPFHKPCRLDAVPGIRNRPRSVDSAG